MATHSDDADEHELLEAEVRELLTDAGLRPRDLSLTPAEHARVQAAADAALARMLAPPSRRVPRGTSRRPHRALAIVALAAALAVAMVVVRPDGGEQAVAQTPAMLHFQHVKDGGIPRSGEPARKAFLSLAAAAARQPDPAPGPIQRIVVDALWASIEDSDGSADRPGGSVVVPQHVESYYLPDGRFRSLARRGTPIDDDGRISRKKGSWNEVPRTSDEIYDSSDPGPDYPSTLSTDPRRLADQLIDGEGEECGDLAWCLLNRTTNLHHTYVMTSELKASLWTMLADQPSITYLGATRDRLGRHAVAFTVMALDPSYQEIILADPVTGAWLGNEEILVRRVEGIDFTPPAVMELTALVESSRIEADALPPGTPKAY